MIKCEKIVDDIKIELIHKLKNKGKKCIAIIQVGDNQASERYVKGKLEDCNEIGVESQLIKLNENTNYAKVISTIHTLNMDKSVDGIILQLPLPQHLKQYEGTLCQMIDKAKDVDGFRNDSKFIPCTPLGVVTLLKYLNVDLTHKNVVIIGRGKLVGKPLVSLLIDKVGTLSIITSKTDEETKERIMNNADIIVTAVGQYGSVNMTNAPINKEAIIIDCGIDVIDGKQHGDCADEIYDYYPNVTPRVKGMGLFTRVCLLMNLLETGE